MKEEILNQLKRNHIPGIWRENAGIESGTEAEVPFYGTVRWEHGKLVKAIPEVPEGYEAAFENDPERHQAIRVYLGKECIGIVLCCDMQHDPVSGTCSQKWKNYYGAKNYGKNVACGGRWITGMQGNPRDGYQTMEAALAARTDVLPGLMDLNVRRRLNAIAASLEAMHKVHAEADRYTVASMHSAGATCQEVSGCRGSLHAAIAACASARVARQLLKCSDVLTTADIARFERAVGALGL